MTCQTAILSLASMYQASTVLLAMAILYQEGLIEYGRYQQTQEMRESHQTYGVQKHLAAQFKWGRGDGEQSLYVLTAHFRAMPKAATIRQRQARLVRHWMNDRSDANTGGNGAIVGRP